MSELSQAGDQTSSDAEQAAQMAVEKYLQEQSQKTLLRFITCGSVDDGKSTLIGRLLYESKMIFEDQLSALQNDSKKMGTQGNEIDFALLVDGLAAEREQGITIDVAYRFFSTNKRKYIVADTPGHEQYTRNMVTGASTADLAIVLVDARKGVLTQTKRHTYLVSLMGIDQIILAVNKMDLVNFDKVTYEAIVQNYVEFANQLGIKNITPVPLSALRGDNLSSKSDHTSWYFGPSLIEALDHAPIDHNKVQQSPFRLPVQWVNRPDSSFRGFTGTICSGKVAIGQNIRVLPSGQEATVASIIYMDGTLNEAVAGQAITLTLDREIDISRGAVICIANQPAQVSDQFNVTLIWMNQDPLYPGRNYLLKLGTQIIGASISKIKYQVNVNTLEHISAKQLELNAVAVCELSTNKPIVFEPFIENHTLGSFILIDRLTNSTAGAGTIQFSLMRSQNSHQQFFEINQESRAKLLNQKPMCIWFTGLSGSGKSTIANALELELHKLGKLTYTLDGDNIRHGLNKDLGFTEVDRIENIRRVSEIAKLMVDAGIIVLVTFISPFRADRDLARSKFNKGGFIEVFVDTPLDECEKRDPKGLYKKARAGKIKNFTGIDSPYEIPNKPDIYIETVSKKNDGCIDELLKLVK
jgi:bifunctional enzyme CysN/CysC